MVGGSTPSRPTNLFHLSPAFSEFFADPHVEIQTGSKPLCTPLRPRSQARFWAQPIRPKPPPRPGFRGSNPKSGGKCVAHIFTLTNAKGGCGKTTVALNLAVCFARSGCRTLAIDLDQQGNLSAGFGVNLNELTFTAHRLLVNEVSEIQRYLVDIRPNLKLLPNSIDIEADDLLEAKKVNRELLLRRLLKPVQAEFDTIIIDTPPAMRAPTVNALVVADSVIIPIDSSSFALLGMNQLLKTIAAISETYNPSLRILVLTTLFNRRQNLDKIIRQQVEEFFGPSLVLESIIHRCVGIAEATAMKKSVVESPTTSSATFDFMKLFSELNQEITHEQEKQGTAKSQRR
ncbi:MAG: ParA family protein [Acidimicrobiia bacterium]|nr:ParA family protein [Acidimicrobiia bacterium]